MTTTLRWFWLVCPCAACFVRRGRRSPLRFAMGRPPKARDLPVVPFEQTIGVTVTVIVGSGSEPNSLVSIREWAQRTGWELRATEVAVDQLATAAFSTRVTAKRLAMVYDAAGRGPHGDVGEFIESAPFPESIAVVRIETDRLPGRGFESHPPIRPNREVRSSPILGPMANAFRDGDGAIRMHPKLIAQLMKEDGLDTITRRAIADPAAENEIPVGFVGRTVVSDPHAPDSALVAIAQELASHG